MVRVVKIREVWVKGGVGRGRVSLEKGNRVGRGE